MVVTLGTQEAADPHHSPDSLRNLGYPQAVERALVLNTVSPSSQIEYARMLKLSLTYADDVTWYHICEFSCPSVSTGMVLGPLGY